MKQILDRCFLIVFGIMFLMALFGISGSLLHTNNNLKQISTDIQDLTVVYQQDLLWRCMEQKNKNIKSLDQISDNFMLCHDSYKTKSQMREEFKTEKEYKKFAAENQKWDEWIKKQVKK